MLLVKAVASVSDWNILGLYLGLEPAVLTDIHTTHHVQGPNTLKMVMFDKWLMKCPRASWDDVIEALTDMDEVTTADRIKAGRPPKTTADRIKAGRPPKTTADRIKAGRPPKTGDLFDVDFASVFMYTCT